MAHVCFCIPSKAASISALLFDPSAGMTSQYVYVTDYVILLSDRYAYLLDGKGRVRWRGSGCATEEEAQILISCSKELLSGGG
jgi:hypothetical protein